MKPVKVLDCTLRDGGYYNNWDFSEELVEEYLESVAKAGIDMIELGLRSFPSSSFKGANAFTTESHLNGIDLPEGPKYGVMVDAKTIIKSPYTLSEGTLKLFTHKVNSKLSFVRVAAHYSETIDAVEICKILKEIGYFVGLNLMQSVGKDFETIANAARHAESARCIDVLYFADSLGNMDQKEAERIISAIKSAWTGPIGIHAHDNTSRALSNTLHALNLGTQYLDATITGMGRGAGNTKTETLLIELERAGIQQYSPAALHEIVLKHFEPMQREFGWGTNLLYYIGAIKSVHPTYIQQLYSDNRFGATERAHAISYLGSIESSSFDGGNLEKALSIVSNTEDKESSTPDSLRNLFSGRDVLLVGAGDTVKKYKKGIIQYINTIKPIVISVNITDFVPEEIIDYYAISHNLKYLSDHKKYELISKKIIAPKSRFNENDISSAINYELRAGNNWEIEHNKCLIPYELTAAYAFAICIAGSAKSVQLVGFDGYPHLDNRNKEVQETLDHFKAIIPIKCLTPTNYNIPTGTIYAI